MMEVLFGEARSSAPIVLLFDSGGEEIGLGRDCSVEEGVLTLECHGTVKNLFRLQRETQQRRPCPNCPVLAGLYIVTTVIRR